MIVVLKKITDFHLKKMFRPEIFQYMASGVKSAAFRPKSGVIIRVKRIYFGTYAHEAKILNFIKNSGGIGCHIPDIKTSVFLSFAFSVHDDFGGQVTNSDLFGKLTQKEQESFAKQLAKVLLNLREIGSKEGARKIFKKAKPLVSGKCKYARLLINEKQMFQNWLNLHKEYSKVIAQKSNDFCIAHNDLHLRNVIVDDNFNLVGLIDFGGIGFFPLEYNLRKVPKTLCNLIIKYWKENGYEVNTVLLNFYRARYILSRLAKRKPKKLQECQILELNEILGGNFSL